MAKALMVGAVANRSVGNLASGDETNLFGNGEDSTAEANTQASVSEDCTFSGLAFNCVSGGSGTNNLRFRNASADGNQLATRSGTGIAEDTTNSDTVTEATMFNLAYTDTGTNSVFSWIKANVELASGHGAITGSAHFTGTVHDVASATRFLSLSGSRIADGNATEANVSFKARGYDTFDSLQARVTANARTNNSTFTNRINNADGTGSITFPTGVTGHAIQYPLGDSIGDGQTIGAALTLSTGVEDLTVTLVAATLKSSTGKQDIWCANESGSPRTASATATYFQIGGHCFVGSTNTEAQSQIKPGFAGKATNLRIYLSTNNYSSNATLKLFQNGSAVMTTTITASGGAGWYENTADEVTFDDNDVFSYEITGGVTGTITIHAIGMTFSPSSELFLQALTGTLSFVGTTNKRTSHVLASALSFVGSLTKHTSRAIAATLDFVGTMTTAHIISMALAAALSFVGALSKHTSRDAQASLDFVGSLSKNTSRALDATLNFVGSLSKNTSRALDATLDFVGSLSKRTERALDAALDFVGNMVSSSLIKVALDATLSFIGSLTTSIPVNIAFEAALSFVGSLTKRTSQNMSSSLSFVGSMSKSTSRAFTSALNFVGSMSKSTSRAFTSALSFVGSLAKSGVGIEYFHSMTSALSFVGTLSPQLFSFSGLAIGFFKLSSRPIMWILTKASGVERSDPAKKSEWVLPN